LWRDSHFKVLVMRARRGPQPYTVGYTIPPDKGFEGHPQALSKNAGYEDVRRELRIPERGETYEVKIELKERPH
jgi:hypothetical protein